MCFRAGRGGGGAFLGLFLFLLGGHVFLDWIVFGCFLSVLFCFFWGGGRGFGVEEQPKETTIWVPIVVRHTHT